MHERLLGAMSVPADVNHVLCAGIALVAAALIGWGW